MGCRSFSGGPVVTILLLLAAAAWCVPAGMAAEAKKEERKAGRRPAADARQPSLGRTGPAAAKDPFAAPAESRRATPPGIDVAKRWTAAEDPQGHKEAIKAALASATQMEFSNESFANVIDYLKDKHQIEIQFDRKTLEEVGFATDKQVTINVKGVTLRSALGLLLRAEGLTWMICDEVLLITTPDEQANLLTTEIYEVADLAACRDEKGQPWDDYGTLVHFITSHIQPTTWDAVGGPGAISGETLGTAKVIVVTQTLQVHDGIEDLLARIRAIGAKSKGDKTPPTRARPQPPRTHKKSAPSPEKQSPPTQGAGGRAGR
jgi:hypothetical protein